MKGIYIFMIVLVFMLMACESQQDKALREASTKPMSAHCFDASSAALTQEILNNRPKYNVSDFSVNCETGMVTIRFR